MTPKNFQKYFIILLVIFAALYGVFLTKEKNTSKKTSVNLNWLTYEQALKESKSSGKPVLIDFYSKSCVFCEKMDETTYRDALVVEFLNKEFLPAKVDKDNWFNPRVEINTSRGKYNSANDMDGEDIAAKYNITGVPTVVITDSMGTEMDRLVGYREPEVFMRELRDILKQKNTGTQLKDKKVNP